MNMNIMIRPMHLRDLDRIIAIDSDIRSTGKVVTYAKITSKQIITAMETFAHIAYPESYGDFISRDMSGTIECCFVAEVDSEIRGFVIGQSVVEGTHEESEKLGEIMVIGVHPSHWRKGIARRLLESLYDAFRKKGIGKVRILIDKNDGYLMGLCERMGFDAKELVEYTISI